MYNLNPTTGYAAHREFNKITTNYASQVPIGT